jgi:bacterial/archaeal transporter family protein
MNYFLWAIAAACIWGVVPLIEKLGLAKVAPVIGLFYRCLGVLLGLILLGVFAVRFEDLKVVPPKSIALLVLAGFLASIVAQICFYHSLKSGEISRVVPIAGAFPLVAFILGVVFFRESLTWMKTAGIALIVSGILFLKSG